MIDPKTGLPPRYLRAPDAARFLGISIRTLEKHRTYGTGPTYRKIGGRIVYSVDDHLATSTAVRTGSSSSQSTFAILRTRTNSSRLVPMVP